MRLGNIELRKSNISGRWQLVRHDTTVIEGETKPIVYVVADFHAHKEGYDMHTVGERFFMDPDAYRLAKHAIVFLNGIRDEMGDRDGLL